MRTFVSVFGVVVLALSSACNCGPLTAGADAGSDAGGPRDSSVPDAGVADAGRSDGGRFDAGRAADAGPIDAGLGDAGLSDAGCSPFVHQSQGFHPDLSVMRYRVVGASPDGQRIALLTSHFGPSSGDPFSSVTAYQAGSTTVLFTVSRVQLGAGTSEAALAVTELDTLADPETLSALQDAGIVLNGAVAGGLPAPFAPVAWCLAGQDIVGQPEATFASHPKTCPGGHETDWSLCSTTSCLQGSFDCGPALTDAALVDRFAIHGVDWAIAEQQWAAISPLTFTLRTAAGGSL